MLEPSKGEETSSTDVLIGQLVKAFGKRDVKAQRIRAAHLAKVPKAEEYAGRD